MLRRFEQIKNRGIFENYRWDSAIPDFERINLIYGTNGAGKTSLARSLDSLNAPESGFTDLSIRMGNVDGSNIRDSNQAHDSEFTRVFVFSEGYVSRSHNFEGDTEVEAVLTLGERTVEDEKRIKVLQGLIKTSEDGLPKSAKAVRAANKALDDEYTTISRGVVTALSRAGGEYRSNGSYSRGTVKNRFSASRADWATLSEETKSSALATVNSDERQSVPTKSYTLAIRAELAEDATEALLSSPVSVTLDTLKEHEGASSWVESGRHIHKELGTCVFCGGELTDDRKRQIEQHFSKEVEDAQRKADDLISEVKELQSSSQSLLGDGSIAGSLFDDLRSLFSTAHAAAKLQTKALDTWLANLLVALETKRANVITRVEHEVSAPSNVDGSKLEAVLTAHNERVSQHVTLVQAAAKNVEIHLLKEAEVRVDELSQAAETAAVEKTTLETTLREYREEVAALENVEGDPLPSAEVLARELTRILGRNELSFELLPDGKHYRVTRYGGPARDLSTGERTAISLIHFLENVKTATARIGSAIVVVDDPVSSLDNGAAMGISTYIWSEAITKKHIEQVFLLTHNFELFRQWDIQISGLPGKRGPSNRAGFTSNSYELVAPHKISSGITKRVPAFVAWPPNEETRVKVRSSYHHAFITAVRAQTRLAVDPSMETKLDALLLYPNVLRRMLETFLAFKAPASVGDFTRSMRDIGGKLEELGYSGDADGLRLQLTRFTHAYSHAESPETDGAASPEEIGAIIAAVFRFMHAVDEQHFIGLCEVVGLEPAALLLETPAMGNG